MTEPPSFRLSIRLHGDLGAFVSRRKGYSPIMRILREKTSVKDAVEACGVPHPEIDLILLEGDPVGFEHQLNTDANLDVYPVRHGPPEFPGARLQRRHLTQFVADGHLGGLARNLRLLGFDVLYEPRADDRALLEAVTAGERALLTRDRRLLMHRVIRDGYFPRSQNAFEQIAEVLQRFELRADIKPFRRCIACNGLLEQVEKAVVVDQLEPLTRLYYEKFRRCTGCGKIYWEGSHFRKLRDRLREMEMRLRQAN